MDWCEPITSPPQDVINNIFIGCMTQLIILVTLLMIVVTLLMILVKLR
jgi:hypothetical protein